MIKIRKSNSDDFDQLLNLLKEFYIDYNREKLFTDELKEIEAYKDTDEVMFQTAKEYINDDKYILYVAEIDNRLVGYICGQIKEKEHKILSKEGFIEDWFVSEQFRNKKFGFKLYQKLISTFKDKRCNVVAANAYAMNQSSIEVYHKLGFCDRLIGLVKKIEN